jgi:large subunit ribosomal protein L10
VGVAGLNVESFENIRRKIHSKNGKLKVAKNTLLKIAIDDLPNMNHLESYFKGQIAVVFTPVDKSPEIAKILSDFAKENEKLKLIAGCVDNRLINANQIELFAKLPTRDQLLAQLAGLLKSLISRQAIALNQIMTKLVWALDKVSEKKK